MHISAYVRDVVVVAFALHVVVPMVLILSDSGGGICGSANLGCVILVSYHLCF